MKEALDYAWKHNIWTRINFIIGTLLVIASWFCPPLATIDSSVLAAIGELSIAASLITFFDSYKEHTTTKIRLKELEIELHKEEKNEKDK